MAIEQIGATSYEQRVSKIIHSIPLEKRDELVSSVQGSVHVVGIKGPPSREIIWGVVSFMGLPFVFLAYACPERRVEFLSNGRLSDEYRTNWWPHAPYNPSEFKRELEADRPALEKVAQMLEVEADSVFTRLDQIENMYDAFEREYNDDKNGITMQGVYGAAIARASDTFLKRKIS